LGGFVQTGEDLESIPSIRRRSSDGISHDDSPRRAQIKQYPGISRNFAQPTREKNQKKMNAKGAANVTAQWFDAVAARLKSCRFPFDLGKVSILPPRK